MTDKKEAHTIEVEYVCNYCHPQHRFKKQLKTDQHGVIKPGQAIICPRCTNFLKLRSFL